MVANATPVQIQVLIGDDQQDWTSTLESFDVGWSKRDRSGLFFIDGTLVLNATFVTPESTNPRLNPNRWARGQKIFININLGSGWVRHPLGELYIIKEPIPPNISDKKLTIKVGCILRLRDYKQPDADNSFVTPGEATNRGDIIKTILDKGSNIPFNQTLNDWPLETPIPKQDGGSFVSQAGEVAYAALKAIHQKNNGTLALRSLKAIPENPIITISVGGIFTNPTYYQEISYEPLEGSETPADVVKAVANYKSTSSGLGTQIIETWEYAPAQVLSPLLQGIIVSKHTVITDSTFPRQRIVQERVEMPLGLINSTAWPSDPSLSLASDSTEIYTYEGSPSAKLINIIKDTKKPFVSAMPDYWNALDATNKNATKNLIIYAQKDITEWQYGVYTQPTQSSNTDPLSTNFEVDTQLYTSTEVPSKEIVTTYETIGSIVSDEGLLTNADQLSISQIQTTQWINAGNESTYRKIESTDTAIGKGFSNAQITGGTATQRANLKLSVINTNYQVSISNSGQNNPPAAERAPAITNEKEQPIQGSAKFKTAGTQEQPRERVIQVKYAISADQLAQIAQVEGTLLIGKRLGQRLQIPFASEFVSNPDPCPQIISIEPDGTIYQFIADGIEYSHTPTKAVIGFDGIWIATLPSQSNPLAYSNGVLIPATTTPPYNPPSQVASPTYNISSLIPTYTALTTNTTDLAVLPPSLEFTLEISGGFVLGGDISLLPYDTVIPTDISLVGGFVLGGNITSAVASNLYGGFVIGGTITVNSAVSTNISGGIILGGSVVIPTIDTVVKGGFVVGGSVTVTSDLAITGGFVIGGSVNVTTATSISVVGGIVLGGNINVATIDTTVKGGFVLGGSITASVSVEAETTALLARFSGTYDSTRQTAIDTFIKALKTAGVWSTIDALYILAALNSSDAALNWKSTSYTISVTGSPTFTTDRGYGTNWSTLNYLNTGFTPSTAGGNYTQNSFTLGVYSRTNDNSTNRCDIGVNMTVPAELYSREGSLTYVRSHSNTFNSVSNSTNSLALTTFSRTASNLSTVYKAGSSIGTSSQTSSGIPSGAITIGASRTGASTVTNPSTRQLAAAVIAGGWTAQNHSDFNSALVTYMTAIGANV